jgi:uncharacterized protein (TIGR03067 family)
MCFVSPCAALLCVLVSAVPESLSSDVRYQPARRFVTIEREGLPPIVVGGSDVILARNDLVGTWQVNYLEMEGESRPDLATGLQMKFSRGRLELLQPHRPTIVVAYDIDLNSIPPRFTWTLPGGSRLTAQKGVYWLERDSLMICLGAMKREAATEFLTQPGDGRTLFILQRTRPTSEAASLADPQWMHLGTFLLAKADQPGGTLLVRLAVDRQGLVAGDAYDLTAKANRPLKGTVDTKTRRISWTVGTEQPIVIATSLDNVTQTESSVQVRYPTAAEETWTMRYVFAPAPPATRGATP